MEFQSGSSDGGGVKLAFSESDVSITKFNFTHISPAILELITEYLSGFDVMALCFTCSKALWSRMRAGGARKFIILPTTEQSWSGPYFGLLQHLPRLTTIVIHQNRLPVWQAGYKLFECFPSTVRSISLNLPMPMGEWLLIDSSSTIKLDQIPIATSSEHSTVDSSNTFCSPDRPASKPSRTVPKRKNKNAMKKAKELMPVVKEKKMTRSVDPSANSHSNERPVSMPQFTMATIFPQLESLIISGGVRYLGVSHVDRPSIQYPPETLAFAKALFIQSLPPSLCHISLPDVGSYTWKLLESLPRSLITLDLTCMRTNIPAGAFKNLPPELTDLTLDTSLCHFPSGFPLFQGLPTSIERLSWSHEIMSESSNAETDLIGFVGHPMTNLTLRMTRNLLQKLGSNLLKQLPRRLTNLKIVSSYGHISSDSSWSDLPQSLTSFTYLGVPEPFISKVVGMPSQLTYLNLKSIVMIDDDDIASLPRSIETLMLETHKLAFNEHTCRDSWCSRQCEEALQSTQSHARIRRLSDACALSLPPFLTFLQLENTYFGEQFLSNLPSTITHLEFASLTKLGEKSLAFLPPGLTHLSLERSPHLNVDALKHLPSKITFLKVWDGMSINDKILSFLPRGLKHLRLEHCKSITDEGIRHLPRELITLTMPQTDLTAKCAKHLPRNLNELVLERITLNGTIKSHIMRDMPHAIQIFDLPWTNIKGKPVDLRNVCLPTRNDQTHI
jgi:hypothetical protein